MIQRIRLGVIARPHGLAGQLAISLDAPDSLTLRSCTHLWLALSEAAPEPQLAPPVEAAIAAEPAARPPRQERKLDRAALNAAGRLSLEHHRRVLAIARPCVREEPGHRDRGVEDETGHSRPSSINTLRLLP